MATTLTSAGAALAQDRAYEIVTPAGTSADWVNLWTSDPDGEYVYYDLVETSPDGAVPDGVRTDGFAARREADGWSRQWITPQCSGGRSVFDPTPTCDGGLETNAPAFIDAFGGRSLFVLGYNTGGGDVNGDDDAYFGDPDGVTLLTANWQGVTGPGLDRRSIANSLDLSTVAFSSSDQLLPIDNDTAHDIYAYRDGQLTLVTAHSSGALAACPSGDCSPAEIGAGDSSRTASGEPVDAHGISDDGSTIFFTTSKQLVAADTDATVDLYVRDDAGVRRLTPTGTADIGFEWAAVDGSTAFFTTTSQVDPVADTDSARDLYTVDAATGATTLVTPGVEETDVRFVIGSDDGSHVWFTTSEAVVGAPASADPKLYEWDGAVAYVASLAADDGILQSLRAREARAAADGSALIFSTKAQLDAADTNSVEDVYRAADGAITLLSPRPAGEEGARVYLGGRALLNPAVQSDVVGRAITEDGETAFLSTTASLVDGDTDGGRRDIYEASADGTLELVTPPGSQPFDAYYRQNSVDGTDVFFTTGEVLVPWDEDGVWDDVYNARRGGGFAGPPLPQPECVGDACQGSPRARPELASPVVGVGGDVVAGARTRFAVPAFSSRQLARLARGRKIRISVRVSGRATVRVVLRGRVGRRAGVVARGVRKTTRSGRARVPVRLSRRARAHLRRGGTLRLKATIRVSGAAGPRARVLTLRSPRTGR